MIAIVLAAGVLGAILVLRLGGFFLRLVGGVAVLAGLLGTIVTGDAFGLLIAIAGAFPLVSGRSRFLDRRRWRRG